MSRPVKTKSRVDRQVQSRTGVEIVQGKTTVTAASLSFDLTPQKSKNGSTRLNEAWRMPCERGQYGKQIKDLQKAY